MDKVQRKISFISHHCRERQNKVILFYVDGNRLKSQQGWFSLDPMETLEGLEGITLINCGVSIMGDLKKWDR